MRIQSRKRLLTLSQWQDAPGCHRILCAAGVPEVKHADIYWSNPINIHTSKIRVWNPPSRCQGSAERSLDVSFQPEALGWWRTQSDERRCRWSMIGRSAAPLTPVDFLGRPNVSVGGGATPMKMVKHQLWICNKSVKWLVKPHEKGQANWKVSKKLSTKWPAWHHNRMQIDSVGPKCRWGMYRDAAKQQTAEDQLSFFFSAKNRFDEDPGYSGLSKLGNSPQKRVNDCNTWVLNNFSSAPDRWFWE